MKRRSVVVARRALRDLDRIYERIKSNTSALTAKRYIARIRRHFRTLDLASQRGGDLSDWQPGLRSIGFEGRVQIAFEVDEERVVIVRVFYGGEDWEAALRPKS